MEKARCESHDAWVQAKNRTKGGMAVQLAVKRGFDPQDGEWFSGPGLLRLQAAQEEVLWLLDRNYSLDSLIPLVGGHHQLSARQRIALQRSAASRQACNLRHSKQMTPDAAKGVPLSIDGFNLLITLETALSGSLLIRGADGVLRDLAGLRGTYRLISQTDRAIDLLGQGLQDLQVQSVLIYLDAPVSNSGRLRQRILERSAAWRMPVDVLLVPTPDPLLVGQARVVSSDSVILDRCASWLNLADLLATVYMPQAWIVNLGRKEHEDGKSGSR